MFSVLEINISTSISMTGITGLSLFFSMLQALVVLVHDMGPNWELVSDAINSTLQIKVMICKYACLYSLEERKGAGLVL